MDYYYYYYYDYNREGLRPNSHARYPPICLVSHKLDQVIMDITFRPVLFFVFVNTDITKFISISISQTQRIFLFLKIPSLLLYFYNYNSRHFYQKFQKREKTGERGRGRERGKKRVGTGNQSTVMEGEMHMQLNDANN